MGTKFDKKNRFSHLFIMGISLSWAFAEGWFMAQGTDASLMWYDGLKEVRSEWLISDFWIPLYQTDCTLSSAESFLLYFCDPACQRLSACLSWKLLVMFSQAFILLHTSYQHIVWISFLGLFAWSHPSPASLISFPIFFISVKRCLHKCVAYSGYQMSITE